MKNLKTHVIMMKIIHLSCKTLSSLLTLMISNQEPLRYVTAMKLGFIPTEGGTRSYVLTSYFKVNECEMFKMEKDHHSGARYLSLPDLMGTFMPAIIVHQDKE